MIVAYFILNHSCNREIREYWHAQEWTYSACDHYPSSIPGLSILGTRNLMHKMDNIHKEKAVEKNKNTLIIAYYNKSLF